MSERAPAGAVVRRHVVIRGRVQGVGFRVSCARRASAAGVGGWVRNCEDGSVEAVFEGDPGAVGSLVVWCRQGPPMARVTAVDVDDREPEGADTFGVR